MHKAKAQVLAGIKMCARKARRQWREHQRIKRTKRNFSKNDLLRRSASTSNYVNRIQDFWVKHYGRKINPIWHLAITTVTDVEDERFIPQNIWFEEILPRFNDMGMRRAYLDKNLARTLISPSSEVPSLFKVMHGAYYSNDGKMLAPNEVDLLLMSCESEVIIKRADTDNGQGVRLATLAAGSLVLGGRNLTLRDLEASYGRNFTIQPRIGQHPVLAAPHPDSLNTVRIVTFRWCGEIRPLLAFVRMGVGGSITDNAGTGGICRGVGSDGRLSLYAVDAYGGVYSAHPSTGYDFRKGEMLPAYHRLKDYAVELHSRVFHFDVVSWDFSIDESEAPVFLEMNFQGASYVYQFACGVPIFGDLTNSVLELVGRKAKVHM